MYLSTDMWYKKVQVILGLIKRENLIVVTVAKREKWASLPSFYTPLPRLSAELSGIFTLHALEGYSSHFVSLSVCHFCICAVFRVETYISTFS